MVKNWFHNLGSSIQVKGQTNIVYEAVCKQFFLGKTTELLLLYNFFFHLNYVCMCEVIKFSFLSFLLDWLEAALLSWNSSPWSSGLSSFLLILHWLDCVWCGCRVAWGWMLESCPPPIILTWKSRVYAPFVPLLSLSLYIYIYIFIFICICIWSNVDINVVLFNEKYSGDINND